MEDMGLDRTKGEYRESLMSSSHTSTCSSFESTYFQLLDIIALLSLPILKLFDKDQILQGTRLSGAREQYRNCIFIRILVTSFQIVTNKLICHVH